MLEEKYINPFTDFGFGKLFGEEISKDLLIDFLNQLLPFEHKITELKFKQTENLGTTELDRKAIFDIYCENENGEKFIVELQKAKQNFFKDRMVYYSTFPIQEQAKKGDWDYKLTAIYCVGILDFIFDDEKEAKDKYIHRVALTEQETKKIFFNKLHYIYLEMPKFNKKENELITEIDKWSYFIKNLSNLDHIPNSLQNKVFIKAFEIAEIAKFDRKQLEEYELSLKYYRDLKNVVDTSFEEGIQEGIKEGIQVGKFEEKILIAKEMKKDNESIEKIIKYTGLTRNEIERL
jgi:predicted transposase/invertase (TIGR01784 family)